MRHLLGGSTNESADHLTRVRRAETTAGRHAVGKPRKGDQRPSRIVLTLPADPGEACRGQGILVRHDQESSRRKATAGSGPSTGSGGKPASKRRRADRAG